MDREDAKCYTLECQSIACAECKQCKTKAVLARIKLDKTSLNNHWSNLNNMLNTIYMHLCAYMQCNQLQLQITRDQLDNIKLYDSKIEES